jgi:gliding motility-associated-like protein
MPALTCPGDQSITIDGKCQYIIPDFSTQATFSDFCDAHPTFSQSPAAGTAVSGILTLNITVTDAYGNSNTCALQTQPDDLIDPTITCPSDTASCTDIFTFNTPFGNDNCGIVTVTQTDATGLFSGDNFPVGTTTIEYTATDQVGNTSICDFNITVYPTPIISMISPTTIGEQDSILLTTTIDAYDTLIWTPTYNLSNDTTTSPWASPNATTTYQITAISVDGCTASESVEITVIQIEELIINNYLSPNGDGKNEFWTMNKPSIISGCTVSIYDRWAKLVWETTSYENQWNGNNSVDEPLPDGTYFYNIVCPGEDDIKGSILLIR